MRFRKKSTWPWQTCQAVIAFKGGQEGDDDEEDEDCFFHRESEILEFHVTLNSQHISSSVKVNILELY